MAYAHSRPQAERRQAERDGREDGERHQVLPERRDVGAFEHDRAQRDEEVARRHDVRDPLHHGRHAGDRKDEPRQDERRQQRREQRELERDLLGLARRRDQQPLRLRADQEQADRSAQQQPRAAHRQVEEHHRRRG